MKKNSTLTLCTLGVVLTLLSCNKDNGETTNTNLFKPDAPATSEPTITPAAPSSLDLSTVGGHPILFLSKERMIELRAEVATSLSDRWAKVKATTDRIPNMPSAASIGENSLRLRDPGTNIGKLAFAAYLTKDPAYISKVTQHALTAADYPIWGGEGGDTYGLPVGHMLEGMAMAYDYLKALQAEDATLAISDADLEKIKLCLYTRTTKQYEAYKNLKWSLLQNHTWINAAGMLASALALRDDYPQQSAIWITFVHEKIYTPATQMLSPDGASQEGPQYWGYGMDFYVRVCEMAKHAIKVDYYAMNDWWKNTARWSINMLYPVNTWTDMGDGRHFGIINFADATGYIWNTIFEPLLYKLADLNNDPVVQYFADKSHAASSGHDWQELLWYNPSLIATPPTDWETMQYFNNLDYVISRTNWSGDEAIVTFKCGAPMGKRYNSFPVMWQNAGDLGHVHPDANHFSIFANGAYVLRNPGYVQRVTRFHNVPLVESGYFGQASTWYTPFPLNVAKDPYVKSAISTPEMDVVQGVAGNSYVAAACVTKALRTLAHIKEQNAVVINDKLSTSQAKDILVRFFPEATAEQIVMVSDNVYQFDNGKNMVRLENLTPRATVMSLNITAMGDRNSPATYKEFQVFNLSYQGTALEQITAISWAATGQVPAQVQLISSGEKTTVKIASKSYIF